MAGFVLLGHILCKIALTITLYTMQFLFLLIMFAVEQGGPGEVGPNGPSGSRVSTPPPPSPRWATSRSIINSHHSIYTTRLREQDQYKSNKNDSLF